MPFPTDRPILSDLANKVARDSAGYSVFESATAWSQDIMEQVEVCAEKHKDTFDSGEFCVVMIYADEPLIKGMKRRKFYAWPFLPKPRASQTVWYVRPKHNVVRMLWALPAADTIASLALMVNVDPSYRNMKRWSEWIYEPGFYEKARKEFGISMLSEEEHLEVMRKKNPQLVGEDLGPTPTNPIDSIKFAAQEVADS